MKERINILISKPLRIRFFANCLQYSLLMSVLLGAVALFILIGVWCELAVSNSVVLVDIDNHMIGRNLRYDMHDYFSNTMILSSRDHLVIALLLVSLHFSLCITFLMSVLLLVDRIHLLHIWVIMVVLILVYLFNLYKIPMQLSGTYLVIISTFWFSLFFGYFNMKNRCYSTVFQSSNRILIAYASQSGTAQNIANKILDSFYSYVDIQSFSSLTPECLQRYDQLLVIASTYGNGQAPEKSLGFYHALQGYQKSLSHLHYAVLALGDRTYPDFCAFGHKMCYLFTDRGARAMQPVQEVDCGDMSVVSRWFHRICNGLDWHVNTLKPSWIKAKVIDNRCVNLNRSNRAAHSITLFADNIHYEAGDLLEVITPMSLVSINKRIMSLGFEPTTMVVVNDKKTPLNQALTQLEWRGEITEKPQDLINILPKLKPRVYSIASAANNNKIKLFVRKLVKDDTSLGFTSAALCHSFVGNIFDIKVRTHECFRLPNVAKTLDNKESNYTKPEDGEKPVPIIMIAGGTGIAPFMGFLAERSKGVRSDNWLIFGEQYSQSDDYFGQELAGYLTSGTLNRLDYAFSRDKEWLNENKPRYVGDVIHQQAKELCYWLFDKEAHVYVCGNKLGLGESIKCVLRQVLKENYERLEQLDRLHFDLY